MTEQPMPLPKRIPGAELAGADGAVMTSILTQTLARIDEVLDEHVRLDEQDQAMLERIRVQAATLRAANTPGRHALIEETHASMATGVLDDLAAAEATRVRMASWCRFLTPRWRFR